MAAPAVAATDIVGGAGTAAADVLNGAGALAGGIVGGIFSGATALVGGVPYTYNNNCAYGYPGADGPPYGYYGAGYAYAPTDYGAGYAYARTTPMVRMATDTVIRGTITAMATAPRITPTAPGGRRLASGSGMAFLMPIVTDGVTATAAMDGAIAPWRAPGWFEPPP